MFHSFSLLPPGPSSPPLLPLLLLVASSSTSTIKLLPLLLSPASAETSSLLLPASWPETVYKGGPIGAPAEGVAAFLGAVCCSSVGKYDLMFCWLGSSPALKYIGAILIKVNIKGVRVNNLVKTT